MIAFRNHKWIVFKVRDFGDTYMYRVYYAMQFRCLIGENGIGHRWLVRQHQNATPDVIAGILEILKRRDDYYYNLGRDK